VGSTHKPSGSMRGKLEESNATAWKVTRFLIFKVIYQSSLVLYLHLLRLA
jgi:hypothetical protein